MASSWYNKALEGMLSAYLNSATVKAVFINTALYTFSISHQYRSSVPAGAQVGTPQTLTNKTFTNGTFNADDIMFPAVAAGPSLGAILGYVDTGNAATDPIVFYYDESSDFPIAPDGGNLNVLWHASGIASLVNT